MFVCICILANILSSSNVLSSLVCNGVNAEVIDIKGRWPEVVGLTVEDAENIIRKDKPRARSEVVPPNCRVTCDFKPQRVGSCRHHCEASYRRINSIAFFFILISQYH